MDAWTSTAAGHQPGRGGRPGGSPVRAASSSSASGSPCAPRTAASRTACAQGAGRPVAARSATVRTACSTRCRAVASSSVCVRTGSRPVLGSHRSWYQRHSRSQGVPHARLALRSHARSAASPAAVAPTASASRAENSSRAASLSPVRRPVA
ncbi:hypothetical protein SGLAM104S_05656 [Streptomyces glaucescens]